METLQEQLRSKETELRELQVGFIVILVLLHTSFNPLIRRRLTNMSNLAKNWNKNWRAH
jgi:hypothetical protein